MSRESIHENMHVAIKIYNAIKLEEKRQHMHEISLKTKINAYTKMKGDVNRSEPGGDPYDEPGDSETGQKLVSRRAKRMLNKIRKKHGDKAGDSAQKASLPTDTEDKKRKLKYADPLKNRERRFKDLNHTMKDGPRKGKLHKDHIRQRKANIDTDRYFKSLKKEK